MKGVICPEYPVRLFTPNQISVVGDHQRLHLVAVIVVQIRLVAVLYRHHLSVVDDPYPPGNAGKNRQMQFSRQIFLGIGSERNPQDEQEKEKKDFTGHDRENCVL
jgi:hypothetical protein